MAVVRAPFWLVALLALVLANWAGAARADPSDVDAAARSVVRVVLIGSDGEQLFPISHGSGFAIAPGIIVTNAHVVRDAQQDDSLRIGIVPPQGKGAGFAKIVALDPRRDLALLKITEGALRLPALALAGALPGDMSEVYAVGYPMNVDRAQGLELSDIFRAQPPVKSRGFISGERPSRQFDSILHTAPIARGNSGGPLLDGCGRVLGVNSFGADSDGSDAEFYFAVSLRELAPFLRDNGVEARVNGLPCRSIAELDSAERALRDAQRAEVRERLLKRARERAAKRERAQFEAQLAVMSERENAMALAMILLLVTIGAGYFAYRCHEEGGRERARNLAGAIALASLAGTIALWITRPGIDEIDRRVEAAMNDGADGATDPDDKGETAASEGAMLCSFLAHRSRVTSAKTDDIAFEWTADGCVNNRTQYGYADGEWKRVLVPNDEDAVSVNSYDPKSRIFKTERYLLDEKAMDLARAVRQSYTPPKCGVSGAAAALGEKQTAVLALLPDTPNERLVFQCQPRPPGAVR